MKLQYMGDFAESPALVPTQHKVTDKIIDGKGKELEAKVQNGTLVVKEKKVPEFVFKKLLKFGDKSDDVKSLQNKLVDLGYYSDVVDGIFGFQTMISVKKFQTRNNINVTGKVDAETFNAIYNPPKEVQQANKVTESKTSNKKKLLLGGIGIVGAYLLMKE